MTNGERIQALKAAGYKVRVEHLRTCEWHEDGADYREAMTARQMAAWNERFYDADRFIVRPFARGGETVVTATGHGLTAIGRAHCSRKDNYCKETGLKLALDRLELFMALDQVAMAQSETQALRKLQHAHDRFMRALELFMTEWDLIVKGNEPS